MSYNIKQGADGSMTFENTTGANETLTLEADNTVKLSGVTFNSTELGFIDGVTAGTAAANKAVVLDSGKGISTITSATITTLTSTTGNITTTNSTTVNGTTVNAGADASAGTIQVFPTTTAKGKTTFTASDNAGDTTTNINTAAQAGARTYTVPDAGASAQFVFSTGLTVAEADTLDVSAGAPGTVGTPASGTVTLSTVRCGDIYQSTFTLTGAQIPVTDGGGAGSYGTLKLLDFPEGMIQIITCSQVYTAYSPDGTGVPDDTVFEIGLGTTAIAAAADGTLGGTEDDIGGDVNQTLSSGTTTGNAITIGAVAHDGTATALDLNLNWSGTAATVDGNGTIDVTGVIKLVWAFMGDA